MNPYIAVKDIKTGQTTESANNNRVENNTEKKAPTYQYKSPLESNKGIQAFVKGFVGPESLSKLEKSGGRVFMDKSISLFKGYRIEGLNTGSKDYAIVVLASHTPGLLNVRKHVSGSGYLSVHNFFQLDTVMTTSDNLYKFRMWQAEINDSRNKGITSFELKSHPSRNVRVIIIELPKKHYKRNKIYNRY